MGKPSIWFRAYRAFRIKVLREPAWMRETLWEMSERHHEYMRRPEVIERMRSMPPSFIYERGTGKITRIGQGDG